MNPGSFLTHGISGLAYADRQALNGVETYVISGEAWGKEDRTDDNFDVTFWVSVEDGSLLRAEASGGVPIRADATIAFGELASDIASFTLTWDLFDHGKEVPVVLPNLAFPLFGHDAVALDDDRILLSGGFTGIANNNVIFPSPLPFVQTYDPTADTWTYVEPLLGHSFLNSSVKLTDGRVLLVGVSQEDATGAASIFDPTNDSWELLPGEPALRGAPHLVLLADGRVLAIGGIDLESSLYSLDPSGIVEIFDPQGGQWERKDAMPVRFDEQALAALPDGRALVMGILESSFDEEPSAWVYDPSSDVWGSLELVARSGPAIALPDGRVLLTGAPDSYGFHSSAPDEWCDPALAEQQGFPTPEACRPASLIHNLATGTTSFTGPVSHVRAGHTLTLLPDGRVLAAGGISSGDPSGYASEQDFIAATEIYDPRTDTWTTGPDLSEPRYDHTATLLPDGQVLLVGGIGQEKEPNPPGSEKEIYPLIFVEVLDLGS